MKHCKNHQRNKYEHNGNPKKGLSIAIEISRYVEVDNCVSLCREKTTIDDPYR